MFEECSELLTEIEVRDDFDFGIAFHLLMEMFLAPISMVHIFRSLFILREYFLMNRNQFLTSELLKQGYRYSIL